MTGYLFWHTTLLEILWVAIGLVGLFFTVSNLRDINRNIEAVRKLNGNRLPHYDQMLIVAFGHYRNELFRVGKTVTIIALGVLTMGLRNASSGYTTAGVAVTIGFFMIALLIVLPSILDKRQRLLMSALSGEKDVPAKPVADSH